MVSQCPREVCILLILLLPLVVAVVDDGATPPPFVRSRYSQRWRRTTTMPLTTGSPIAAISISAAPSLVTSNVNSATAKTVEEPKLITLSDASVIQTTQRDQFVPSLPDPRVMASSFGRWLTTTERSKQRSSTHPTDYDYYSENEIEANELHI